MVGLGGNKAKLLASAEKNVKQGKLQNAIADYERVISEDPRDLNVLNTIGDLYSRLGNAEQATTYFQRVGDAYASEGFTVKAIAVYKKITKQNPNAWEVARKLADLYAQQGLNSDARVQYTAVAEHYLRGGDTNTAVAVFQKILEMDPDNPQLQSRLADLYVRIGKKPEARDIFFRSAQALRSRGSVEACDTALGRVLELDRNFAEARLLRAEVRLERDDAKGAVQCLESIADIDSRADGLRLLVKAHLKLGQTTEAEPHVLKLAAIFNDVPALTTYADALVAAGNHKAALRFYKEHAPKLLSADTPAVVKALDKLVTPLKDDASALETISDLFQQAGDTTHAAELAELLAHACVHGGDLAKAKDIYQKLAEIEPENPLHLQNRNQIAVRLGEDSTERQLTPEQSVQPLMVEDLEQPAPLMAQGYSPDLAAAVRDALTDAELFASYNLPARAIPPLEAILPRVPRDIEVNQRLIPLYARTGRAAEAVQRCQVLKAVYAEANLKEEAEQYEKLIRTCSERAGLPLPREQAITGAAAPPTDAPAVGKQPAPAASVAAAAPASQMGASGLAAAPAKAAAAPMPAPVTRGGAAPPADAVAHEIDLSEEWERVLTADKAPAAPASAKSSVVSWETKESTSTPPAMDAALGDIVEEVRFYLAQSMGEEARGALARAEAVSPTSPVVVELRTQVATLAGPPVAAAPKVLRPATAPAPIPPVAPTSPIPEFPVAAPPKPQPDVDLLSELMPPSAMPPQNVPVQASPARANAAVAASPAVQGARASSVDMLGGMVLDLEQSLGADFLVSATTAGAKAPQTFVANPLPPRAPAPAPPIVAAATSASPEARDSVLEGIDGDGNGLAGLFAEFKQDLEKSSTDNEDPETHYNLGVAFKEMGLLDEAIGELQKVCKAIERGQPFSQTIQAYTWLADCFVQKGVPEAGVHWYQKALHVPGVGDENALAMHYELACAHEAAGDIPAAREHFMHVLSRNIDYRDVAERIKALKS